MTSTIFDKTDKGREEIATRKYHLSPRLRTLLVIVDGKHAADDLLKKVGGLGINEESIAELLNNGFIQATTIPSITPVAAAAPLPPTPQSIEQSAEATSLVTENVLPEGQTQFEAIYHFYTKTIKSTIGLRGYGLQLKVEKAASIDDFRQLRAPYVEAVLKAKGEEMARSLRDRLDQLLNLGANIPSDTTIPGTDNASTGLP